MNEVRLHTRPLRRGDVEVAEHGEQSILVVPGRDTALVLNPTARALWDLCDGATDPHEMADAICEVFDVERAAAVRDVEAALTRFRSAELLEVDA